MKRNAAGLQKKLGEKGHSRELLEYQVKEAKRD
jgi:hypothetical protein